MRIESSVTSVSWIPKGATEGFNRLTFGLLRVAHFDPPPPDVLGDGDLDRLLKEGHVRFVNRLEAWVEVEDGRVVDAGQGGGGRSGRTRVGYGPASIGFASAPMPELRPEPEVGDGWVRFTQTAGGVVGIPTPRRVRHPPFVQITPSIPWTTLALTIHADGTVSQRLTGASSFPRHWVYDHTGRLVAKSGFIDYDTWWREAFGTHTPWGDEESAPIVTAVESALERQLSVAVIDAKPRFRRLQAGRTLVRQGEPVTQVGPGAILGEMAMLQDGRRTATLRAVTPCRVAVVPQDQIDRAALEEIARGRTP